MLGCIFSASSLNQQSTDRHGAPLEQLIPKRSHQSFVLDCLWCMPIREATINNCIVIGLTRLLLEPTFYRTPGEHTIMPPRWLQTSHDLLTNYIVILKTNV